jgi:leucyl-tRNA synthetase
MVCKETYRCGEHDWIFPEDAEGGRCRMCERPVEKGRVEKMSKSKKNVIDPDALIERYGADTLRLFSLFAAPPERDLEWSDKGVEGAYRFLHKVWTLAQRCREGDSLVDPDNAALTPEAAAVLRKTHQTIRKVTEDIERDYHFNTAIAALMELVNEVASFAPASDNDKAVAAGATRNLLLMLAPFAPHFCEELWESLGGAPSIFEQAWPAWNPDCARDEEIELVVQVNGKLRARITAAVGLGDDAARELALNDDKIREITAGKTVVKVIVIQGRLVNIVIK